MSKVPSFYNFLFPGSNKNNNVQPVNTNEMANEVNSNKNLYVELSKQLESIFEQMRQQHIREQQLRKELEQSKKNTNQAKQNANNARKNLNAARQNAQKAKEIANEEDNISDAFRQLQERIMEAYTGLQSQPNQQESFLQEISNKIAQNREFFTNNKNNNRNTENKNNNNKNTENKKNNNTENKKNNRMGTLDEYESTRNQMESIVSDRLLLILEGIKAYLSPNSANIKNIANRKAARLQEDRSELLEMLREKGVNTNQTMELPEFTTKDFLKFAHDDLNEILENNLAPKDIEHKLYGMRAGLKRLGELLNRPNRMNNSTPVASTIAEEVTDSAPSMVNMNSPLPPNLKNVTLNNINKFVAPQTPVVLPTEKLDSNRVPVANDSRNLSISRPITEMSNFPQPPRIPIFKGGVKK